MENDRIKNYYKILNVSRTASKEEIKAAYRQLVKIWHPDINHALNAKEKFQEISEAYEILYNDDSRKKYEDLIRACMQKSADARDKYNSFRQNEQYEARKEAEKYCFMSLDGVMHSMADVLFHGEKAARVQLNVKAYHVLGWRVMFCWGLVALMGTVILTIPAIILITHVIKGFFYKGTFVGIVPIIKGFLLVFIELLTICGIVVVIQAMLGMY